MADYRKAQNVEQTNETAHQRRSVEPINQEWVGLQSFDLTTLQRSVANPSLARPDDILKLQRAYGNQAVTCLVRPSAPAPALLSTALGTGRTGKLRVQAKLMVGPVGDKYEQEADRVAEQVMSMPNPQAGSSQQSAVSGQPPLQRQAPEEEEEIQTKPLAASITPLVQRQAEEEEEVQAKPLAQRQDIPEEEEIQTKPLVQRQADGGFEGSPDLEHRLAAHKGGGNPLSAEVRAIMEPRFGADFGGVQVHMGSEALQMTRELKAQAFTLGQDIYFGAGRYNPGTTAGKRLLAHELTHTIQQTGGIRLKSTLGIATGISRKARLKRTIQRQPLTADQMMDALEQIDFVREKLEKETHKEQMRAHVKNVLQKYEAHFAGGADDVTKHAMMLTMAIDGVARVIAGELLDPFKETYLARKLFELFRPDIEDKLAATMGKGQPRWGHRPKLPAAHAATSLTSVLVSGNPVAQYMHEEIRLEAAAQQVLDMAQRVNTRPLTMFDLLNERFQAEVAAYTKQQIEAFQHMGVTTKEKDIKDPVTGQMREVKEAKTLIGGTILGTYSTQEAPGELSTRYFERLFGKGAKTPQWFEPGKGRGLRLSGWAVDRLADLRLLVWSVSRGEETLAPPQFPARAGLTSYKQERHLEGIEETERREAEKGKTQSKEEELVQFFQDIYLLEQNEARTLMITLQNWLRNEVPLTITRSHQQLFGGGVPAQARLTPGTAQTKTVRLRDIFGGRGGAETFEALPPWQDRHGYEPRGERYAIFRMYKDQLMTSLLDFEATELPVFGAVSPGWETTRGTEPGYQMGKSYYGDTHYLLHRDRVSNRVVYTATDFGEPRRDPFLALHDLAFGGEQAMRVKIKSKDVKRIEVVNALVLAATRRAPVYAALRFELQIFGPVDIASDVKGIYFANDVPQNVFDRAVAFKNRPGTAIEEVGRVGDKPISLWVHGAVGGGAGFGGAFGKKLATIGQLGDPADPRAPKPAHLQKFSIMIRELKDPRWGQDLAAFKRRYECLRQEYLMGKVGLILKSNATPLRQLQDRIRELYSQACRYADATISFLEQTKVKPRGGLQIGQRPNR
jgi:hypothetical protein